MRLFRRRPKPAPEMGIPAWDEGVATLWAKLPALVREGRLSLNDARTIEHLAGLMPPREAEIIDLPPRAVITRRRRDPRPGC